MKTIQISFLAHGYVNQTVEIPDDFDETELEEGLNSGKICTTIQENGSIDILATGKKIGTVVDVENNLEYEDFDVESE